MFKKFRIAVLLVAAGFAVTGCSKFMGFFGGGSNPKGVADKFWNASKSGQVEKMKPYVTSNSLSGDMMQGNTAKTGGEYVLGAPKIEGDKATIATTLKDKGFNIDLQTIVVKENGQWKVDVPQTMATMFGGAMGEMMKGAKKAVGELGEAVGKGLQEMGKELAKSEPTPAGKTFNAGDKVQVEWHGSWYPAKVLEVGSNKWKIHYDGYDNSWDEWVEPNRIK